MLRIPKYEELVEKFMSKIFGWIRLRDRRRRFVSSWVIHWESKALVCPCCLLFSTSVVETSSSEDRREENVDGNQVSDGAVEWCWKADVVKHCHCCAKWNERKSPGETQALNMNWMESPALSPRINHAQRCVNERPGGKTSKRNCLQRFLSYRSGGQNFLL